nr:hypothetical protein [Tanacetum cinerariifolium]
MANLWEDIQCAGFDTRPPMLDRTDFASWQQCIRLYCRGKENGVNILKSIDEGPYQMRIVRETLAESKEEAPQFGESIHDYYVWFAKLINDMRNIKMTMSRMQLNSKFVNNMLPEWGRFVTPVKLNRGLRDSNYDQLGQGMTPQVGVVAGYGGAQNGVRNVNPGQARPVKCYNCNGAGHIARNYPQPKRPHNFEYYKDKMLLMQDLALNVGNVFQADDRDAFNFDVDEALTEQTMFMANLSSANPVTDEGRPSHDSDILSEYVKDNEVPFVHSNVSSVPNDAFMMIYNDMCEPHAQSVSNPSRNTIVKNSLTAKLATYKEHVELLVISDHNFKEETLKKEIHSIKLQLASTINHNKSMVEEVTFLKKDFKQKENKYLEDFLDMKYLKEKVEDRLIKQDQSLQTVHMLCRPKPYYNEKNKVAIGYKNPLYLTHAKQVQPALYNGHEIIKDNHASTIVHNIKDTLEIAEITRKKMNDKMKDPKCLTRKVKIAPHDYSKENFLATFTPQKQLTLEQIFWSNDLIKLKSKALKEQIMVSRPIKELTVKHDAIDWKNLLIANDNLITECLSKEVFSVATNSELNVARFTEMTVAHTTVEARCLEFEAELANLRNFRNNPSTPDKDTPDFDSVSVIGKMQASLQGKDNVIRQLKRQIFQLQVTRSDTERTIKVQTTDSQITKLTEQVTNLQAENNLFRAENDKIKQYYKELY